MAEKRTRRPHGELRLAMHAFLSEHGPASLAEIRAGVEGSVGIAPDSSYRSALQDERYFERVQRGIFKIRADSE